MLTFVESISLAGDRKKQNDDACGFAGGGAWVIDGATDLHDAPLTNCASDASWFAHRLNAELHETESPSKDFGLRETLQLAIQRLTFEAEGFLHASVPKWRRPIASVLMLQEDPRDNGVHGLDLGDCRVFALDAEGHVSVTGGPEGARDAEAAAAAKQTDADKPLLQRHATLNLLRQSRASLNQPGAQWTACLDPACVEHARRWSFQMKRPAHLLLMTDGFAVLADQYGAYDPAGLVRAAVEKGLQELGREIRAIENEDAGGAAHPRFKKSDDATALLMRLT
jgi:hypothetical protein